MDVRCVAFSGGLALYRVFSRDGALFTGPRDPCLRVLASHREAPSAGCPTPRRPRRARRGRPSGPRARHEGG